jgi:hypothetical protein
MRYQKLSQFITRERVSLKSMLRLYVNPRVTSLALYLKTLLFSFRFQIQTHLNLIGCTLEGVGITTVNTSFFFSDESTV